MSDGTGRVGFVHLVGAGPGDPELLTLRARAAIEAADVVVYDAPALVRVVGARAAAAQVVLVAAGDGDGVVVERALGGSAVARLYPGDAFLSGAAVGAALALADAGVAFEVVPGVPVEVAAAAAAGVPLGGAAAGGDVRLARGAVGACAPRAMVLHADAGEVAAVARSLLAARLAASTPAALVALPGAYPARRTRVATLGALAESAGAAVESLVVVGEGVALQPRLCWFESRPLFGRRVVITRPRSQAAGLAYALERLGAEVFQFPTIRIVPPRDPGALARAAADAADFDWIVFTSVNGVDRFWSALRAAGRDTRSLHGTAVCAIGPATAAALGRFGVVADLVPERYVAEEVVAALVGRGEVDGRRFLLPRAAVARSVLPDSLRALGAEVADVAAYETVAESAEADGLREVLRAGQVDWITFTASSTVRNFVELLGAELHGARVASIGPITSQTARGCGLPVDVEAEEYTVPGLVAAMLRAAEAERA